MINKYLKYLQEDNINEFVVLPVMLGALLYRKYTEHKKIARHCLGSLGDERRICFLEYKIYALYKTRKEILKFKSTCKKWSTNVPKCLKKVDKQVEEIDKKIKKKKISLAKAKKKNGKKKV